MERFAESSRQCEGAEKGAERDFAVLPVHLVLGSCQNTVLNQRFTLVPVPARREPGPDCSSAVNALILCLGKSKIKYYGF